MENDQIAARREHPAGSEDTESEAGGPQPTGDDQVRPGGALQTRPGEQPLLTPPVIPVLGPEQLQQVNQLLQWSQKAEQVLDEEATELSKALAQIGFALALRLRNIEQVRSFKMEMQAQSQMLQMAAQARSLAQETGTVAPPDYFGDLQPTHDHDVGPLRTTDPHIEPGMVSPISQRKQ